MSHSMNLRFHCKRILYGLVSQTFGSARGEGLVSRKVEDSDITSNRGLYKYNEGLEDCMNTVRWQSLHATRLAWKGAFSHTLQRWWAFCGVLVCDAGTWDNAVVGDCTSLPRGPQRHCA